MRFFLSTLLLTLFSFDLIANEAKSIPVNESKIILHDGAFEDGLPDQFNIDVSKKFRRWGWGNWSSSYGYANIGFSQLGPSKILTESGMIAKKILKNWNVENFKLGKKKGFKSDGKRALIQLAEINNLKCVVAITRFGMSGGDAQNRFRSTLDGYICKNSGDISIDEGMNFVHCMELKGQGTHFRGKEIDDKCTKKETAKKVIKQSSETKIKRVLYCKDNEDVHEYINGPSSCYDGQTQITKEQYLKSKKNLKNNSSNNNEDSFEKRLERLKSLFDKKLITKEEYDVERKEVLDEM